MATGKTSLSKEAKTALKAAKEAIKNKEYKEAIKQCKIVFKEDKNNYNGLVFVGVAAAEMGQLEQGVAAYRKAIDAEPNQELAWQGLCSLYEKSQMPEHTEALMEAYPKLVKLFAGKDDKKWEKTAKKMIKLLQDNGRKELAFTELHKMITSGDCHDNQILLDLQMLLVDMTTSEPSSQDSSLTEKLEDAYKAILNSELAKRDVKQEYHGKYITFILNRGLDVVKEECAKMHEDHPSDPYPMAVLVEFNLQRPLDAISDDVFITLENLRVLDPSHPLIDIGDGQTKLSRKNYQDAKTSLIKSVQADPSNPFAFLFLTHCHVKLHSNKLALRTIEKGLNALKEYSFPEVDKDLVQQQFLLLHTSVLLDCGTQSSAAKALQITEKLTESNRASYDVKMAHMEALLATRQLEEAKELLSVVTAQPVTEDLKVGLKLIEGQIKFHENHLEEALICFREVTASQPDNSTAYYWQGRAYWHQGDDTRRDKSKCYEALVTAAKLDPNHSDTFLYFGYFYQHVATDMLQAKRCYQQSYLLNSENEEAGCMLGDALIELGETGKAFDLYNSVTSRSPAGTAKWAWLRLGLYHFKFGDPTDAINSFQSALRADPLDKQSWECLGDAYMKRGSYNAAMKTFTKGLELGGSTLYCRYQIAAIKQTLGLYSEAVLDYDEVLKETKNYVPALKGLGETYLSLARTSLVDFFNGRAVDYVEMAVQTIPRASILRPDLCCLWNILGSACSLLFQVDEDLVRVKVPSSLLMSTKSGNDTSETRQLGKSELLVLGARCYTRALQLQPNSGNLWCDLGVNYFYQSQIRKNNETLLATKAFQCIYKAISLERSNHKYWTTLGVISNCNGMKRPSISQHCFIKSIEIEPKNVVAWTNLGVLYLMNGEVRLAHEAFKIAQSLEPSYVQCWIGQAIVAESIGNDEAMDLFRHTTELTTHYKVIPLLILYLSHHNDCTLIYGAKSTVAVLRQNEGSIGYAHWVCQTLLDPKLDQSSQLYLYNILQMNAVPQALVAMEKHNDRYRSDPSALLLHGLLLERQRLYRSAVNICKRCVSALENCDGRSGWLTDARINYARCLSICGATDDAIKQYEAIGSLTDEKCRLDYAACLYKVENYEKCFQVYQEALEACQSEETEAHILAAMGMVAYKCGDLTQTKTMLFKSSQKSPPSEAGLKALCALGLLSKDANLSQAVITELEKQSTDGSHVKDLVMLKSTLHLIQGQKEKSLKTIISAIHRYPWLPDIWQTAAEFIIQSLPSQAEAASLLMRKAHRLQKSPSTSRLKTQALCNLAAGRCTKTSSGKKSYTKLAERAVFMFPDDVGNRSLLAASLIAESFVLEPTERKKATIDRCLNFVNQQAKVKKNSEMEHWSVVLSLWWTLHQCHYDKCLELAKTYTEWCDYPEPVLLQIRLVSNLAETLKLNRRLWELENLSNIKCLISEELQTCASLQLLGTLYQRGGRYSAAEQCYRLAMRAEGDQALVLMKMCKLASDVASGSPDDKKWISLAKEAFQEIRKTKSQNPVCVSLLQGILKKTEGNERAKNGFQSVLEDPDSSVVAASVARYNLVKLLRSKHKDAAMDVLESARNANDPNIHLISKLLD